MEGALIVSGWDPIEGYSIYNVTLGGTYEKKDWAMSGKQKTLIKKDRDQFSSLVTWTSIIEKT